MNSWGLEICDNCGEFVETYPGQESLHIAVWYGISARHCMPNGDTHAYVMPEAGQTRLI